MSDPVYKPARYLEIGDKIHMTHGDIGTVSRVEYHTQAYIDAFVPGVYLNGVEITFDDGEKIRCVDMFACQMVTS